MLCGGAYLIIIVFKRERYRQLTEKVSERLEMILKLNEDTFRLLREKRDIMVAWGGSPAHHLLSPSVSSSFRTRRAIGMP